MLSTLLISLSCWAHLASADLKCVPSMSYPSGLAPNQEFTLGFQDNDPTSLTGSVKAMLVCWSGSSIIRSVLTLGQNYNSRNFSPNSPTTSISVTQAKKALASCPSNNFVLLYELSILGSTDQAVCSDNFSLQVAPTSSVPITSIYIASQTLSATSRLLPTVTATGTPSLSASYTLLTPSPSTHPGGNDNSGGNTLTPIDPTPSGHNTPEDMKDDSSTSPSIGLITGASVGVVALIFVILVVLLVWRKRQQAQARIDDLFNYSLMASSGFQNDKPIYGRSDPHDDHSATHPPAAMDALAVPMNHEQYRTPRPRPRHPQTNQPLPQLPHAAAQHPHYRRQQQNAGPYHEYDQEYIHKEEQQQQQNAGPYHEYDQEYIHKEEQQQRKAGPYHEYDQEYIHKEEPPPQRQPSYRLPYSQPPGPYNEYDQEYPHKEEPPPQRQKSYRLPYSQPANDYNYPRGPQGLQ